ncbi:hypothetical protein Tco_1321358 [Tanacetum coccineum]
MISQQPNATKITGNMSPNFWKFNNISPNGVFGNKVYGDDLKRVWIEGSLLILFEMEGLDEMVKGAYVGNEGNKKYTKYKEGTLCKGIRIFFGLLRVGYFDVIIKLSLEHFDVITRDCDAVSTNCMPHLDHFRVELQSCPVSSQIESKSRVFPPNAKMTKRND